MMEQPTALGPLNEPATHGGFLDGLSAFHFRFASGFVSGASGHGTDIILVQGPREILRAPPMNMGLYLWPSRKERPKRSGSYHVRRNAVVVESRRI